VNSIHTTLGENDHAVDISVLRMWWGVWIDYRGTMQRLLSLGALTVHMAESLGSKRPGSGRRDEDGFKYTKQRAATIAFPDRIHLRRSFACPSHMFKDEWEADLALQARTMECAMRLPGMRSLFPSGIGLPSGEYGRRPTPAPDPSLYLERQKPALRLVWT